MKNFFKKNNIIILLLLGVFIYLVSITIAELYNIPTKDNLFAFFTLLCTLIPIIYAGIIYIRKIKLVNPVRGKCLAIFIVFVIFTFIGGGALVLINELVK